jgi:hypothetical protein
MDFITTENILNFAIIAAGVVVLLLVFWLVYKKWKERGFLGRGMNLQLFLVTLPQRIEKEKGKEVSLEEFLKTSQQFYSSLAGIKEKSRIKRWFLGNPAFVFEVAVHRLGEQIYFYVACPRFLAAMIEKEILGFWSKAQVQPVPDYNIFNPAGIAVASRAHLKESPAVPLRSFKEFGVDPLSAVTSVFTKLAREDEGAAVQIVIRPTRKAIKKRGQKMIDSIHKLTQPKPSKPGEAPKPMITLTPIQQQKINAISEKISQPLFDVNLRLLASAPGKERAEQILIELESAFDQFSHPLLNQIVFKKPKLKWNLKKLFYRFSFRIFNEQESIVLSAGELAGIFHFPSPQLLTPHVKWLKAKQAPAPDNLPEEGLLVGQNIFRDWKKEVRILDDDRRRHFYIIGQTGTGKSVLLQEMIKQDMEAGKGVCLIDPHGDFAGKVLSLVPPSRAEDVIYFDPSDAERPLGLNMLEYDAKSPGAKTFVVNELLAIFDKLYNLTVHGFGGPMFEQYMRNALLLIMEDPESGSTLIEVPKVLADSAFRKYKLSKCKNVVVKNFWELEAEKAGGEAALANMVPYITSKLNIFIANDLVRPIISQQQSSIDLRQIMDEGKILIVNLPKGKLGDINCYLLGMIIIGKILLAAYSRADLPEEERRDFYLYIDEFQNVATETLTKALAEARKYRLSMTFGHQFIGQLEEEKRKAIFGNVGTILTFRVGPEDAKTLLVQFEPVFDEEDLVNIDNYHAAFRLLIKGETSRPFNIKTYPPSKGNPEVARLIKEYSRVKYGRDRALVEGELYQRLQKNFL